MVGDGAGEGRVSRGCSPSRSPDPGQESPCFVARADCPLGLGSAPPAPPSSVLMRPLPRVICKRGGVGHLGTGEELTSPQGAASEELSGLR